MSDRVRLVVLAVTTLLILGWVNVSILRAERILATGETVLLELAPRDPRSLLQGDYMALRYAMADDVAEAAAQAGIRDGRIVIALDESRVAGFVGIYTGQELGEGQRLLRFRRRGDAVRLASDAWFFEEGDWERFAQARFGELRLTAAGEALLTGLRDAERRRLGDPGSRPGGNAALPD